MYRGYPVGELMFWKNADQDHTRSIGDAHAKTQDMSFQVVDGQQRLTSLYAVVKGLTVWRGDYTREKVVISFNPLTERFEVPNAATRRSSEWIDDITEIFKDLPPQMPTSRSTLRSSMTATSRSAITPMRTWIGPPTPPGLTPAQVGPSGKFNSPMRVACGPWPISALK